VLMSGAPMQASMASRTPSPVAPASAAPGGQSAGMLKRAMRAAGRAIASSLPPTAPPVSRAGSGVSSKSGGPMLHEPSDTMTQSESADKSGRDELSEILSNQSADGSFGWNSAIERVLTAHGHDFGKWSNMIIQALPTAVSSAVRDPIVQTVIALMLLRQHLSDREPLWRRASRKAIREYLPKALGM